MLMRRDFDLNSVDVYADSAHVYTDSVKEIFRKTMVSQEIVFQNQVHELHRIYGTQRTLMMQNNSWMEFDRYNLNNKVGSTNSKNREFLEERHGVFCNHPHRNFGHVDHPDNLKLSLSIDDKNKRKQSGKRTWFDVNLSREIIDLEDSTETMSDLGREHSSGSAALPVDSTSKHESQKSVVTDPVLDDHERISFHQDFERFDLTAFGEDLASKKQQRSSYVMLDLDLNKVYRDDSSCQSSDLMIAHPSRASSPHGEGSCRPKSWTKECNNFSDEASGIGPPDNAQNCSPVCSKGNYVIAEISTGSPISKQLCSKDKVLGPKENQSVGPAPKILKSQTHSWQATKEANHKKWESEDVAITHLDRSKSTVPEGHSDVSSSSLKTCHVGDNESSNEKTTQSEVELGNHVSIDRSSGSSESDKFDVSIREAAESLIRIAFAYSDCYEENECSVDSFELFTLGLKECTEDDLCVSSKATEVDVAENKDYGLKIRRGRRLKDFQRDILPGLASLARHEIREDINILEGVLRSREYKKMQAKMADDGHSWCVPTRSRRSRLSCSKRRRFS